MFSFLRSVEWPARILLLHYDFLFLKVKVFNVILLDGRCNLEIHPHHITCLTWPVSRGFLESEVGIMDSLLVGRIDGSLAVVEVYDRNSFTRVELEWCSRDGGSYT